MRWPRVIAAYTRSAAPAKPPPSASGSNEGDREAGWELLLNSDDPQ